MLRRVRESKEYLFQSGCHQIISLYCVWRLILSEFIFGCKFTGSQLIKYQDILEISEYLVEIDGFWDLNESLIKASRYSNSKCEIARLIIDGGADSSYNSALCIAAKNGHLDIVKYLVEYGADKSMDF